MSWYAKKRSGTGQGLVIEENTGRTVAVAYDDKDAPLLAAAPDLLAALEDALESLLHLKDAPGAYRVTCISQARAAIARAKETT
jgi:hypothetical protein